LQGAVVRFFGGVLGVDPFFFLPGSSRFTGDAVRSTEAWVRAHDPCDHESLYRDGQTNGLVKP